LFGPVRWHLNDYPDLACFGNVDFLDRVLKSRDDHLDRVVHRCNVAPSQVAVRGDSLPVELSCRREQSKCGRFFYTRVIQAMEIDIETYRIVKFERWH